MREYQFRAKPKPSKKTIKSHKSMSSICTLDRIISNPKCLCSSFSALLPDAHTAFLLILHFVESAFSGEITWSFWLYPCSFMQWPPMAMAPCRDSDFASHSLSSGVLWNCGPNSMNTSFNYFMPTKCLPTGGNWKVLVHDCNGECSIWTSWVSFCVQLLSRRENFEWEP